MSTRIAPFQLAAYMGSANPKSIEALRWAAMEDGKITAATVVQQSFEEHNAERAWGQQQQRSPTSTDAALVTGETCRVDSTED